VSIMSRPCPPCLCAWRHAENEGGGIPRCARKHTTSACSAPCPTDGRSLNCITATSGPKELWAPRPVGTRPVPRHPGACVRACVRASKSERQDCVSAVAVGVTVGVGRSMWKNMEAGIDKVSSFWHPLPPSSTCCAGLRQCRSEAPSFAQ
jgi:hypothetical protein